MTVHVEGLVREEVCQHYLTTHKGFERKRGEHVESKAKTRNVDHGVVSREVVENVTQSLIAKREETTQGQDETKHH